jgi:hypothetical protein
MTKLEELIAFEESQIGYKERSDGWTKYGQWYADNIAKSQAFAKSDWCVMYQSYCFNEVGLLGKVYPDTSPQGSSVRYNVAWMEEHGYRTSADEMPKPGDLVYYCWSGKDNDWDHIGLCVAVSGNSPATAIMTVCEGNKDDQVAFRTVSYRSPKVRATCRPPYPTTVETKPVVKPGVAKPAEDKNTMKMPNLSFLLKQGSRNQAVEVLQAALIGNGYDITGGADGYFGQYTKAALIEYQKAKGLIADGTAGTETFKSLLGLK